MERGGGEGGPGEGAGAGALHEEGGAQGAEAAGGPPGGEAGGGAAPVPEHAGLRRVRGALPPASLVPGPWLQPGHLPPH